MKTILVGFTKKVGTYADKQTGEAKPYSNRELQCITDTGKDNVVYFGFAPFSVKMKMQDIAACLGCAADDTTVDNTLKGLYNSSVEFQYAPRFGELAVVGLKILDKPNKAPAL